ncbi:hypothetical protein ATER59S_00151 [Aquamicrobium terrae]
MPLPLEDHVRLILLENERGLKFYNALVEGWDAFDKLYPQRHRWIRKSSTRHMVWEEVARRLKALAADDPGVVVLEHQDTLSLIIEDEVLFRLKHADPALITQNYPTPEAVAFDDHDIDLFGYEGLQRVRLCYVLDAYESALIWVGIAAHSKGHFLWKIELNNVGAVAAPERLPLAEKEADTTKLARLKKDSAEEKKKKDIG